MEDFLIVYNISQEFISSTEKMAKMKALLDQENWNEIDVPDEFQTIVTSLSSDSMSDGHRDEAPGTSNSGTI
ncbi:Vacuolar protein sorting-associated protein 54, chloroplastic [Olea europaea subsp. europaea]|uniref:Vacuolar protein sorting-associated protein 54, chloroplastic n=1 Tax=Olea europaea subsp. europaea TaxID=158383 RepID=A0A8S0V9I2_OLEEU|nr:Vacuolar protein sorting-associated protein 54, chloroplastic [Olea europaea subsp. europaea]